MKCQRCNGLGADPFCIYCMAPLRQIKVKKRRTQQEAEQEILDKRKDEIARERDRVQGRDLKIMLRNMKKVGQTSTGVPSLDLELRELNEEIEVYDLEVIRNNMLLTGSQTCGDSFVDHLLEKEFGPIRDWPEPLDQLTKIRNNVIKCQLTTTGIKEIDDAMVLKFGELWFESRENG